VSQEWHYRSDYYPQPFILSATYYSGRIVFIAGLLAVYFRITTPVAGIPRGVQPDNSQVAGAIGLSFFFQRVNRITR
jgi:hypothetical protein